MSEQLLAELLEEQRTTNQLLLALIEALGEEAIGGDVEPVGAYMDSEANDENLE